MTGDPFAGAKAVFFDAVGTVLHPVRGAPAVYAEAAARYGIDGDPPTILSRFRVAYLRQEVIDEQSGWVTNEAREIERWHTIVRETLPGAPEECFQLLYRHFATAEAWQVPADATRLFDHLASRGLALGLASNYDSRLRSVLAGRTELNQLLHHVAISSEIGVRKPGGSFFGSLTARTGCRPDEIVLVGDDLENDYLGARAAGMAAVLVDPKCCHPELPGRVASLAELLPRHQDGTGTTSVRT
jgi:putative hydrolase of the HAD superfamily